MRKAGARQYSLEFLSQGLLQPGFHGFLSIRRGTAACKRLGQGYNPAFNPFSTPSYLAQVASAGRLSVMSRLERAHLEQPGMAIRTRYLATGLTLLVSMGVASCDSRNKNPVPSPNTPSPMPPAVLSGLDIAAPPSIAPGETVQLSASARKTDNSVEIVTSQGHWYSQAPAVLGVSSSGVASGGARGEAIVRVVYGGWSASARVFVLPPDTHRLNGTVTDSGMGIAGLVVTVIGVGGENLSTVTDGRGAYALYGVRGRVRLQVKGTGYLNRIDDIDVRDHRSFDVEVSPERRERTDLRGGYRLTISRMPCPGTPLPDTRSYDATLTQDGPRLTVTLSGADFVLTAGHGNGFTGFVDAGNRVTFAISNPDEWYFYGPYDLIERVDGGRFLIIRGPASTSEYRCERPQRSDLAMKS